MANGPSVIVFDVNETLSDMAPMRDRFAQIGCPPDHARLWFASLLRDGFALTAAGDMGRFAEIGAEALRILLADVHLTMAADQAVDHIMKGFMMLDVHPDVPDGVRVPQSSRVPPGYADQWSHPGRRAAVRTGRHPG